MFDVQLPAMEAFPTFSDAELVPPTPFDSPNNIDSSVSTASADSEGDGFCDMPEPDVPQKPLLKRQNAIMFVCLHRRVSPLYKAIFPE